MHLKNKCLNGVRTFEARAPYRSFFLKNSKPSFEVPKNMQKNLDLARDVSYKCVKSQ
jgi:hypothetical protein